MLPPPSDKTMQTLASTRSSPPADAAHADSDTRSQQLLTHLRHQVRKGPSDKVLVNRTIRPILIERKGQPDNQPTVPTSLLIPPLGKRQITSAELESYDWECWQQFNLMTVQDQEQPAPITLWGVLWFIVFLLTIVGIFQFTADRVAPDRPLVWNMVFLFGGIIIAYDLVRHRPAVNELVRQLFGLVLIAVVGAALPALIILFVSFDLIKGILNTGDLTSSAATIALFLLAVVITFVASLPAMLYFLFQRLEYQTQYREFLRDSLRLYRTVYTADDITELYGKSSGDHHGPYTQASSPIITYVPVYLLTFLLSFGWSLILIPPLNVAALTETTLQSIIMPQITPITFGFLGSYVFALNFVFRRYARSDLGPKAYSYLAIRLPITFVLVGLMQVTILPTPAEHAIWTATMNFIAFLIGIVPHTALISLSSRFAQVPLVNSLVASIRNKTPITQLEGITLYDETRLLEEGIDNIESLAHHNLIELIYNTRIPTARLVDLVDQAILHLHTRKLPGMAAGAATPLERLREYGIRTATELEQAYAQMRQRAGGQEPEALLRLLDAPVPGELGESEIARLRLILDTLADDMWMPQIRNWRQSFLDMPRVHTFSDFYPGHQGVPMGSDVEREPGETMTQLDPNTEALLKNLLRPHGS